MESVAADVPPKPCVQVDANKMQAAGNTAKFYGPGIASGPSAVHILTVQGKPFADSAASVSVYPGQPISVVASVNDVFGNPSIMQHPLSLEAKTSNTSAVLIWSHRGVLNSSGFAQLTGGNALRLLQAWSNWSFDVSFVASTSSHVQAVVHFETTDCPPGFVAQTS